VGTVVGGTWGLIKGIQSIILTLIFFSLLFMVLAVIGAGKPPKVPVGAALVVSPSGLLVEQLTEVDPFSGLIGLGSSGNEVLVDDVVVAIDRAASDKRITTLVLRLDDVSIPTMYASKGYLIAQAVDRFKAEGKSVIALGNRYSQAGYLIASHADEIWMHPFGSVMFQGYGRSGTYFKSMYEKLLVTVHPFRVGEFKSAIEPFVRDDMSEAAKQANMTFLGDMWAEYTSHVEAQRGFDAGTIQSMADSPATALRAAGGDAGKAALDGGVVDALMSGDEWRAALIEKVGAASHGHSFKQMDMYAYLAATNAEGVASDYESDIAVIVAKGNIVNGEAPRGTIGGDTVARLIRNARDSKLTKAIVLRVDSGGGSAFASEVIRREIVAAQEAGIPVVASMGSIAVSGGYWISASADEIWAEQTTVTGSIGVLGVLTTFENLADWAGVHSDGVGTAKMAAAGSSLLEPLDPQLTDIIQQSVENIYERFVHLVATSRSLPVEHVRMIGEGRVWSAPDALEHGLVDSIGGLDDAIAAAAKLAKVSDFNINYFEKEISPFDQLINEMRDSVGVLIGLDASVPEVDTVGAELVREIARGLEPLTQLNDPSNVYLICEVCDIH
jgi:protease-4